MTVSVAASAFQLLRSYQHVRVLPFFSVKFPACHASAVTVVLGKLPPRWNLCVRSGPTRSGAT